MLHDSLYEILSGMIKMYENSFGLKCSDVMDLLISYAVIITAGNAGNSLDWSLQRK